MSSSTSEIDNPESTLLLYNKRAIVLGFYMNILNKNNFNNIILFFITHHVPSIINMEL